MKLFGISGTNGSGKDTVGQMLAERHNYLFVSGSDILRAEASKRGLPVEREVLRTISAEWRRESGLGVLIDKAVAVFNAEPGKYSGLVVASLRNPGEVVRVHELGGQVIWVDADPKTRYDRIFSRQRTDEDKKTFDQFCEEEAAEMAHSGDEATLNMSGVKDISDIFLANEGDDKDAFMTASDQALNLN
ncbi:MAG: AAA family ATPase [Candidatus Saccharibacteria bacterium]|nr:AAA family ATPase [Candidatus Saccharibacteria bacterium]